MLAKEAFGVLPDGREVCIFTLTNQHGASARITNYGGILVSLKVPDRLGHFDNVVLCYDKLEGYLCDTNYMGVIAGRYANRICNAKFTLNSEVLERHCGTIQLMGTA